VSGALKSRTTNKNFQLGAKLYRMDEHGHGRLSGGGEIIGDVLLTGVEGVSTGVNMAKNSGFVQRQPVLELGWVWYAREVVLYGRVESAVADELRNIGF
jgi:hypothetical protein